MTQIPTWELNPGSAFANLATEEWSVKIDEFVGVLLFTEDCIRTALMAIGIKNVAQSAQIRRPSHSFRRQNNDYTNY